MNIIDTLIKLSVTLSMENPCLRLGQAHFLALHNIMPELALKIK